MVAMKPPIESRQGVGGGIPVFHRTRVPVFFYLDALDQDMTITEFLKEFDVVTKEHIDGFWELSLARTQT